MIRIERRLSQPRWLLVAVPLVAVAVALVASSVVLALTGHPPVETFRRLFDAAFVGSGALSDTFTAATPIVLTGLAAAVAFRMRLYNIGAEGQLYAGAVTAAAAALLLGERSTPMLIAAMVLAGIAGGAAWAFVPGVLRAFFRTNEIITTLMLNYVAALILDYLIFDSLSYLRDTSTAEARAFPQGKLLPEAATWPRTTFHTPTEIVVPLGFFVAVATAVVLWILFRRTRFGFEMDVIGDSPRAARYAGMRTRRKILAVMLLSGGLAGLAGASQDGDFRYQLDARGLQQSFYGYTGIVVAALGRYNPFAVVVVGFLLGGLQNAGYTLQGADFPAGLVGVIQGLILFSALGVELLVRYRVRVVRPGRARPASAAPAEAAP